MWLSLLFVDVTLSNDHLSVFMFELFKCELPRD